MTRILAVRSDSLGDVLLTGPAIRALAAGGEVTLLCGPRGLPAARMLPGVDEVVCAELPWIDPEPQPVREREMLELVGRLADLQLDEAVIFTSFHQSALPLALLLRMAGVGRIAAISDDYPGSLLDVRHRPPAEDVHEVERALSLAAAAGHPLPPGDAARLAVTGVPAAPAAAAGLDRYVVVHPGASVPARAWPAERHAELVNLLVDEGRSVVVTGDARERDLCSRVAGGRALELAGRVDLPGLAAVLAGAECVVVGNTGPAHLAAAVGTPVVSLFAPVVPPARWRPWGVPVVLLGDQDAECAGSRARECPVPGHPCLAGVSAAEAHLAVGALAPLERPAEAVR